MSKRASQAGRAVASLVREKLGKPITYRHHETREVRILKSLTLHGAVYNVTSGTPAFNQRCSLAAWEMWIEQAEEITK